MKIIKALFIVAFAAFVAAKKDDENDIADITSQLSNLQERMDDMQDQVDSLVQPGKKEAFLATGSERDIAINQLIKFEDVRTNLHGGYNGMTSKFTCNDTGLYLFHVTLCAYHTPDGDEEYGAVWYEIVQDGSERVSGFTGHGVAAVSTHFAMIRCAPGSQVWVKQGGMNPPWKQGMWHPHSQFGAFQIL